MPRLALTSLSLSHFRSYRHLDLAFDGRPVAFFGHNGAGKTNLLEAISMLSPGRGLRRAKAAELMRRPDGIGWRVKADLDSTVQSHHIETGMDDPTTSRKVLLDGKPAPQLALGRIARVLWLVPVMDRLWLEGAADRRSFLDRITMSFEPAHGDAVLAYEKAMRERNRLLKDQVREPSWYVALEAQMAQHGADIIAARLRAVARLNGAQTDADTVFPRADLSVVSPDDDPAPSSTGDLATVLAEGRGRDLSAGRTLTGPHRADLDAVYAAKSTPARLCSTGEQKAMLISIIMANARALRDDFGAPPILLLDEVAAHLDADRRAHLYDEIIALDAQAFMSGTGAELFETLGDRAAQFEVSDRDDQTQVQAQ